MKNPRSWIYALIGVCAVAAIWMTTTTSRAENPYSVRKAAPELTGSQWLNTPNGKPLTLAGRKGKVTLVEFWTFACSNCQANLPSYDRLQKKFADQKVEIIGVHTPESSYEADPKNVAKRVEKLGITYPILLDTKKDNWNRWQVQYWPTVYLIDKSGNVRYSWIGELEYKNAGGEAKIAKLIQQLLNEKSDASAMSVTTKANAEISPQMAKQAAQKQIEAAKKEAVGKVEKTDAEWKKILTPEQFYIMRQEGTERAFSGDYNPKPEPGIFRCAACELSLYDGATEFHSGTGWPSFYQPIAKTHVIEKSDADGMRTEILCARCGAHLGHVFNDGPQPTGLRYCMNSPALKFVPASTFVEETASAMPQKTLRKATFAAGCFWSMEAIFTQLKGVTKVEPGYSGGTAKNPTYEQVGTGQTGYAETVDVTFDPKVISYRELLDVLFTVHDPTTLNRQGGDAGTQYRSAIFYHDATQKTEAENFIKKLSADKVFADPIVTQLQPFQEFYRAEDYHLNYYNKNPNQGYCRVVIAPKIEKFHKKFKDKLKS